MEHLEHKGISYTITFDDSDFSPREMADEEYSILCIREHRHYNFTNELNFDFDGDDAETGMAKLEEDYHIFEIDMYEHGSIIFSLAGTWQNCRFDTSRGCGFIAISKKHHTPEQATKAAKAELSEYTAYCNWEVYEVSCPQIDYMCGGWYDYGDAIKEMEAEIDIYLSNHKKFTVKTTTTQDKTFYATSKADAEAKALADTKPISVGPKQIFYK